jgi:hypothetical protein
MCKAIGGPDCKAVKLMEQKIAENNGKDAEVVIPDSQMRMLLMPHLVMGE